MRLVSAVQCPALLVYCCAPAEEPEEEAAEEEEAEAEGLAAGECWVGPALAWICCRSCSVSAGQGGRMLTFAMQWCWLRSQALPAVLLALTLALV